MVRPTVMLIYNKIIYIRSYYNKIRNTLKYVKYFNKRNDKGRKRQNFT